VEELEFLVDETSETTFDASEADGESFEEEIDPSVMDELGNKIESITIPNNSPTEAAAGLGRSPRSSPQSSRSSSPRTSVDHTRGLGSSPSAPFLFLSL